MKKVLEVSESGPLALWRHPDWHLKFPWLVQGTTGRGASDEPLDFGLFGATPVGEATRRWKELRDALGSPTAVHSRQVHGAAVVRWRTELPAGLILVDGYDAHMSVVPGVLLTVSVADCVPIFLISEDPRFVAIAHAGWRGIVAGVLEAVVAGAEATMGVKASDLWLHCGPSICGQCYEVGPEVHAAVTPGRQVPDTNTPIDLAEAIAEKGARIGIHADRMTSSAHCTRCGPGVFFSHRGGSPARQLGVLGIRT